MSSFISLDFEDFELNSDVLTSSSSSYCVCCLDKGLQLIRLNNCGHANYLYHFIRPEIDYTCHFVCLQCHATLKRIYSFKRQVENSLRILNKQAIRVTNTKVPLLQRTEVNHIEIEDDIECLKKELQHIGEPIVTIHEGETTHLYDELDIQLKKHADKHEANPTKRKPRASPYSRYEGKIKMIQLSREELEEERQREIDNDSFQKMLFKCLSCLVGFDHEANYNDHVSKKHKEFEGGESCDICQTVLPAGSRHRLHVSNHFSRYDCGECGKRYNRLESATSHYNLCHGKLAVQYKCSHCDFTTDLLNAFKYHRNKHKKNLICDECGKVMSSTANLKQHYLIVHNNSSTRHTCNICNKSYKTKPGLEYHNKTKHDTGEGPSFFCVECSMHFSSENSYKNHMKRTIKHVAVNAKRFECNECSAKFFTYNSMMGHYNWVHLKQSKHKCDVCDTVFKTASRLKEHKSKVHDKIPVPKNKICQYCGKAFTTDQILATHIRTHTGERPLQCSHCDANFAHPAALYTHNKLIHKR